MGSWQIYSLDGENIDGFGVKLASSLSKFSLSIVLSSIVNTGGLRCCPSIFCPIKQMVIVWQITHDSPNMSKFSFT